MIFFQLIKILKIRIVIYLLILILSLYLYTYKPNKVYEKYERNFKGNSTCDLLDSINIFNLRIKNGPIEICNDNYTNHICYINHEGYYNNIFRSKNGVLCTFENIILDPSKFIKSNFIYKGPVDKKNKGFPNLTKGFFNTKCNNHKINFNFSKIYNNYFNAWNYDSNENNEKEEPEELAPGKIILLISRNEDSPNLFHGNSEIINIISTLYLFNLTPEQIQIVLIEGIDIPEDPFYNIYKYLFAGGKDPINVKNLTKKYRISKGINIPLNWDSPVFLTINYPKCDSITKTYQLYNDFIDKYMNLTTFKDYFISDNITYYYPIKTIKNYHKGIKFKKMVTIQWRKVWPKGRKGQSRILANATKLADKLAEVLPDHILIRLIDTATLSYKDQISVIRETNYLIGIHGAGLSLSIFLPKNAILHPIPNPQSPIPNPQSPFHEHLFIILNTIGK